MLLNECFDIKVIACDDPIKLDRYREIKRIDSSRNPLSIRPVMIDADPFLVVRDDRLYLFYEELSYGCKGIIKMTSTSDLVAWSEPRTVLTERFHLSYPWVFNHEGQWYMMPETGAAQEVRLYRAVNNDFSHFEYYKTLLSHGAGEQLPAMDFCDSSIVQKDNVFYLFTTVNYGNGNELSLYYSDKLDGVYQAHPVSPLTIDDKSGRNGGELLEHGGALYRFAQDCSEEYGKDINLFAVKTLTTTQYREELLQENFLSSHGLHAGHQYNFVFYKGQYIVVMDQKRWRPFLTCKLGHLFKKLKK